MRVTKFLEKVFEQPVSGNAKLVYFYLISCTEGFAPGVNSTREEISYYCGISTYAVRKAIKELLAAELISESIPVIGPKIKKCISIVGAEEFIKGGGQND